RGTVDALIQGFSGMMAMNRMPDGTPQRLAMVAADVLIGLYIFSALTAACSTRRRTGKGGFLDINLMQSAAAFQGAKIAEFHACHGSPQSFYGPVGYLPTHDGGISVSCRQETHYLLLCEVLGCSQIANDPRFKTAADRVENEIVLMQSLARFTRRWLTDELLQALQESGVLVEKVQSYGEWLQNEHVLTRQAYHWEDAGSLGRLPLVNLPGISDPRPRRGQAPDVGEHSMGVCRRLGMSDAAIKAAR